ncbi:hypothetical protein [Clostridium algidicarnis]|uniref:hypothetical protein n=1 Tax=Clostridium algidicarnis TaxID=37659 RepID=UPI001C0CE4A1|nr:hypothetical protein [Clostridium algidicarnis]MBU3203603.1 hypothetical protein [Clostridium algidicarnis]MBU3211757.1 hypothetical protein [Clostridium algidicarnis]MBU3221736.1 hypothetical protein [Clostridium algidicarnis]
MNSILIKKMSADLNIIRYDNESEEQYGDRLIYCAVVSWARVMVLGKSYTDLNGETEYINADYYNVDIMHIQSRLTQVVQGMLMVIPHSEHWFPKGGSSKFASYIIENLIFCNELSKLNDSRRLTCSPTRKAIFKNRQLILGGIEWKKYNEELLSIGFGRWCLAQNTTENYKEIFNLPDYHYNEYYNDLLSSSMWEENKLIGQYKIFKVETGSFYTNAWKEFISCNLIEGISLLKSTEVNGGYFLARKDNDGIFTARLDQWYYDENEIYRIMYSLDSHNGTPAKFKVKVYYEYVIVHIHSILPNAENRILLMSSWPNRSYDDKYYRVIPLIIWDEIRGVLTGLGIKLEFY